MKKQIEFLPPPKHCNVCGSVEVAFVNNGLIYEKPIGLWPYIYYCFNCRSSVGVHENTNNPFGLLATSGTKRMREVAHEQLDPIWKSGVMSRTEAYAWAASIVGIPVEEMHISWLTYAQLKHLVLALKSYRAKNEHLIQRRLAKRRAKFKARTERESSKQWRREHQRRNSFS